MSKLPTKMDQPALSFGRRFADFVFGKVALVCTFLGMAFLVLFFIRIGMDVSHWFHEMPVRIAQANVRATEKVQKFDAETAQQLESIRLERDKKIAAEPDKGSLYQGLPENFGSYGRG